LTGREKGAKKDPKDKCIKTGTPAWRGSSYRTLYVFRLNTPLEFESRDPYLQTKPRGGTREVKLHIEGNSKTKGEEAGLQVAGAKSWRNFL